MSKHSLGIDDLKELKQNIDKICNYYNVFFYGVFSNTETNTEISIVSNNTSSGISFNNGTCLNVSISDPSLMITNSDQSLNNTTTSIAADHHLKMMDINPNETVDVNNYLFNCFEEFQQIPCKLLSKAWIKIIEPKKQSTFPYKKGNASKPYWWPSDARHKEPDHLKKEERISLLVSLLKVFKNREAELINAASTINELSPKNRSTNTGDDFGSRKLTILKDMFRIVKNNIELNRKTISVIKPGKKYSSQLYQRVLEKKKSEQISAIVTNDINRDEVKISHILTSSSNTKEEQSQQQIVETSTPTKKPPPPLEPSNISLGNFHSLLNHVANSKAHSADQTSESLPPNSPFNISDFQSSPYLTPTKNQSDIFNRYISKSNIDPKYIFIGHQLQGHCAETPKLDFDTNSIKSTPVTLKIFRENQLHCTSPLLKKRTNNVLSTLSPSQMNIVNTTPVVSKLITFNQSDTQNNNDADETLIRHGDDDDDD